MENSIQGMESTARVKVEGGNDKTMVLNQVNVVEPEIRTAPRPTPGPSRSDSRPIPLPSPTPRPKKRRLAFRLIFLTSMVLLATFGFLKFWPDGKPDRKPDPTPIAPPQPQVRVLPVDNTVEGTPVVFKWDAGSDSLGVFTLQFGNDRNFLPPPATKEVNGETHRLEEELSSGTYFWRVRLGTEDIPGSQWSQVGSFAVVKNEQLPVKPDTPISKPPSPIPDPLPDPAQTYEVRIAAKLNGEPLAGDYEITVDSGSVPVHGPNTFNLTAGEHTVKVVWFFDGGYLEEDETISILASPDLTKHFVHFNTRE